MKHPARLLLLSLLFALPASAASLGGRVSLVTPKGSLPASSGVVYLIPDTPDNWVQLNGLAQRCGRFLVLTRQSQGNALSIAQQRLKGLLNRLALSAKEKATAALEIQEDGQFSTTEAPAQVILMVSAQTAAGQDQNRALLAGWWLLRTPSSTTLEVSKQQQIYQVGLPIGATAP